MANRGDVLLVFLPFSDAGGGKVRPGVVVSWDRTNRTSDDLLVAAVTSNTARAGHLPIQVVIDLTTPDGAATGLAVDSVVRCEAVHTISKILVRRRVGRVPPALMAQVDAALKVALDLP